MKSYVIVTGMAFGLLTVAHIWRFIVERPLAANPWFVLMTLATASLSVWAGRLVWPASRS